MMPVATLMLRYEEPRREPRRILIAIGTPYRTEDGDWVCPVAIDGLAARLADIRGTNALQALCLGISVIRMRLEDVLHKGGLLRCDDGTPFDIGAQFGIFGIASA